MYAYVPGGRLRQVAKAGKTETQRSIRYNVVVVANSFKVGPETGIEICMYVCVCVCKAEKVGVGVEGGLVS